MVFSACFVNLLDYVLQHNEIVAPLDSDDLRFMREMLVMKM